MIKLVAGSKTLSFPLDCESLIVQTFSVVAAVDPDCTGEAVAGMMYP